MPYYLPQVDENSYPAGKPKKAKPPAPGPGSAPGPETFVPSGVQNQQAAEAASMEMYGTKNPLHLQNARDPIGRQNMGTAPVTQTQTVPPAARDPIGRQDFSYQGNPLLDDSSPGTMTKPNSLAAFMDPSLLDDTAPGSAPAPAPGSANPAGMTGPTGPRDPSAADDARLDERASAFAGGVARNLFGDAAGRAVARGTDTGMNPLTGQKRGAPSSQPNPAAPPGPGTGYIPGPSDPRGAGPGGGTGGGTGGTPTPAELNQSVDRQADRLRDAYLPRGATEQDVRDAAQGYRQSDMDSTDPRRKGAAMDTKGIDERGAASEEMTRRGISVDQFQREQALNQARPALDNVSMETRAKVGLAPVEYLPPSTGFTTGGDRQQTGRRADESADQFAARRQDIAQTRMNRADDNRQVRRYLGNQAAMRRAANAFYKQAVATGDAAMGQNALAAAQLANEPAPATGMARVQQERQASQQAAQAQAQQFLPDPTKLATTQMTTDAQRYDADRRAEAAKYAADKEAEAAQFSRPTSAQEARARLADLTKRKDAILALYKPQMGQGMMADGTFKTPELRPEHQADINKINAEIEKLEVSQMEPRAALASYLQKNPELARKARSGDAQAKAAIQAWIDSMGLEQ